MNIKFLKLLENMLYIAFLGFWWLFMWVMFDEIVHDAPLTLSPVQYITTPKAYIAVVDIVIPSLLLITRLIIAFSRDTRYRIAGMISATFLIPLWPWLAFCVPDIKLSQVYRRIGPGPNIRFTDRLENWYWVVPLTLFAVAWIAFAVWAKKQDHRHSHSARSSAL